MNLQRTPPTGSHPDLTKLRDFSSSQGITIRNKNSSECEIAAFREELSNSLFSYRCETSEPLAAFQQSMIASLKKLLGKQSEKMCKLCDDVSDVKEQIKLPKACPMKLMTLNLTQRL
ncbi:unnamed protein product [Parnassius apollo]|uniref:(apollo) hypothetical protein n=1 Tax=Parnassius apollo TaxID=110799 RepID=A0A8S3WM90_PARAO|nr:unnamed protein product [Parnassius apollo]